PVEGVTRSGIHAARGPVDVIEISGRATVAEVRGEGEMVRVDEGRELGRGPRAQRGGERLAARRERGAARIDPRIDRLDEIRDGPLRFEGPVQRKDRLDQAKVVAVV